jgi:serine/threonine-protein kinase
MVLAPGEVVAGRFRLTRLVGEGGMGVVWSAEELSTSARIALKFVKDPGGGADRRPKREAWAATAVQHPNVVAVRDVLELGDGAVALVMEYLDGESLARRLAREETLSLEDTARILLPVVSAVGTAHEIGIVHRDLKPENILLAVDPSGALDVKVVDFGLAKLVAFEEAFSNQVHVTTTEGLRGTPCYMAPEQVLGERDLDHRADVWALGLILFQCLTGLLPTRAENVGQVLKAILIRPIWPLEEVAPELPRDVIDLVNRMLSKKRSGRPADLREVHSVLERYTEVTVPAFGAPRWAGPADADDIVASASAPVQTPRRTRAAYVVGAVALLGLAAAYTVRRSAESEPPDTVVTEDTEERPAPRVTSEPSQAAPAPIASASPAIAARPTSTTPTRAKPPRPAVSSDPEAIFDRRGK